MTFMALKKHWATIRRLAARLALSKAAGAACVVCLTIATLAGSYCDEPGTPNEEAAIAKGGGAIDYSFANTVRIHPDSHPNGPIKSLVFFDIEMKERGMADNQGWAYIENNGPHALGYKERFSYNITTQQTRQINPANRQGQRQDRRLQVGKTYCMRVWSRLQGGCRSGRPSSWHCTTVR